MFRRHHFTFLLLLILINGAFGVYLLGQRRASGSRSDYYSSLSYFGNVLEMVHDKYVDADEVDYEGLTHAALQGMLHTLDPHSELLVKSKYDDLQSQTRQEFGGIGIQIERRNGRITIIAPIEGTPGERAGILPGDQIVGVDGENTEESTIDEIVSFLRGAPGEGVDLTIYRPATGERHSMAIVREMIQIDSVRDVKMLSDEIGYVRITQFGDRTGREFASALDGLEAEGMKALVLDLRNNPGGLLPASVEVAGLFFEPNELVVYTQERDGVKKFEGRAARQVKERRYPIALLINSGSASASEIVAGALQDTDRAVVVGETSFGKGSVQSIYRLRNGNALRLTTAKYFTPSGRVIHEHGVEPDIVVELSSEDEAKLQIQRNRPVVGDEEAYREQLGFEPIVDRQLEAAVEALEGLFMVAAQRERIGGQRGDGE